MVILGQTSSIACLNSHHSIWPRGVNIGVHWRVSVVQVVNEFGRSGDLTCCLVASASWIIEHGQAEQLYRLLPFPPEKEDGCEHQSQEKTAEAAEGRQFTFKMLWIDEFEYVWPKQRCQPWINKTCLLSLMSHGDCPPWCFAMKKGPRRPAGGICVWHQPLESTWNIPYFERFFLWEHDVESLARPILSMLPKKPPERAPSALLRSEKEKDIEREDQGPAISAKLVQFLAMLVRGFLDFDPWILHPKFGYTNWWPQSLEVMVICGNGH